MLKMSARTLIYVIVGVCVLLLTGNVIVNSMGEEALVTVLRAHVTKEIPNAYNDTSDEMTAPEIKESNINIEEGVWGGKEDFKFHVYDIPDKYITGAFSRLEENWHKSVCNRDSKRKTNYTMLDWRHAHSLFTVDVFMAKYLRFHPRHTKDPEKADVFIIPTMTHLLNCAGKMDWLPKILRWVESHPGNYYKKYHSHDHFIFWWRWGMNYKGTQGFFAHLSRSFPNINYISYEFLELMGRNKYQDFSLSLKPNFHKSMMGIVMPYPDFSPNLKEIVPPTQVRDISAFMTGTSTIGGIRRWIKKSFDANNSTDFRTLYLDFASDVVDTKRLGVPVSYPEWFKKSVFCVHAAGDGLSGRRPTTAILAGCIPVMVCDLCLYPYENLLDYSEFAIFVNERDVLDGRLVEILRSIPQETITSMRANLLKIRHHFVYPTDGPPTPGDALDTLVEQLSHRADILRSYKRWFLLHPELSTDQRDYPRDPPLVNKYKIDEANAR
eukprot:TRINITY_DN25229_c0_g1_i1.p1 TRINITY_DN25229_c0_g1~~TRINITY_DN25229_c0_g1_i1.p1  ORF type:complete len:495 (+),score=31.32 TRINITY_DN25229_c0_g1_i1:37-1521(+)